MALPVRRKNNGADQGQWGPFGELPAVPDPFGGLFAPWAQWSQLPRLVGGRFTPLADVEETDDAYHVEIELSGVKKEDVDLEIAQRRLTVSGERKEKERIGILRRRERVVGRFSYEVTLPGDVDEDAVEAHLEDGVLTVKVPKVAKDRPRKIEVLTSTG